MPRSLSNIQILATFGAVLANTIDGSDRSVQSTIRRAFTPDTRLASGTGANQADRIWLDKDRTLISGGTENIDLYDLGSIDIGAGAGRDELGQAVTIAEIVALYIENLTSSTGSLIIGGEGSGATWNSPFNASDSAKLGPLPPGGILLLFAPTDPAWAVADSTNHLLKIEASGGAVTYHIGFLGRSA
jgi:hypothetical protein